MNRDHINEYKSRIRLYDDEAKPMGGSHGQYTRLAITGLRPERGLERHFVLFAESTKLFDAIAKAHGTPEWIHEGFDKKWLYIEEILRRPSESDTIDRALQIITDEELWVALFEYLKETGVMDRFASSTKGTTYGLPKEDLKGIGLPSDLNPNTKFLVPKKAGE